MSQSQNTLLQLLLLFALSGAIGGYAYFGVFKKDADKAQKQEHELRLFAPQKLGERARDGGSPPAEFTELSVTYLGKTTSLEKRAGTDWQIVSPVRAKADKLVVDQILSQLQSSKFKATLEENPDDAALAKYGLVSPTFVVQATALVNGEARSVKLVGGIENTFDGTVFVRRNDEKPVFTAEGGVRFSMARTPYDLRDKALFALTESKISKLAVKSTNNQYVLERTANKQWNFVKPDLGAADNANITAMISSMAGERAQAFVDDTEANRKALGFDVPLIDTTATFEGGATTRLRVSRVPGDAGEDTFYGLREEESGSVLAQVGNGATGYDRNPIDLRDKSIVRFHREAVTRLVFHEPGAQDVIIAKESADASADAWRVIAPRAGKAKVFKVTSVLWTLGGAKALAEGEEKPKDWGKYGLGPNAKSIALFDDSGKELGRFVIGKPVPNTPSAFYVRGTREQVLQSDGSRFGEFPFSVADVLDEPGDAGN